MPSPETLALFIGAATLFALAPGPAVFYIVTRSLSQGRRAGVTSATAVACGNLLHLAAALVGVSAVLASSAAAFAVVKYLGAAYLVYLGVRTLLRHERSPGPEVAPVPRARVFRQGLIVAVLNPKTALFFLAFLPQFAEPAAAAMPVQIGLLGAVLVCITAVSDIGYAMLTGTAGNWIRRSGLARRAGRLASGGCYLALGATAAAGDGGAHR